MAHYTFLPAGAVLSQICTGYIISGDDASTGELAATKLNEENQVRRKLEAYHGAPKAGAVDFAWPYLKHADRYIRYAARLAVEHQPVAEWKSKVLAEKDPVTLTEAIIALARKGNRSRQRCIVEYS